MGLDGDSSLKAAKIVSFALSVLGVAGAVFYCNHHQNEVAKIKKQADLIRNVRMPDIDRFLEEECDRERKAFTDRKLVEAVDQYLMHHTDRLDWDAYLQSFLSKAAGRYKEFQEKGRTLCLQDLSDTLTAPPVEKWREVLSQDLITEAFWAALARRSGVLTQEMHSV